MNSPRLRRPLEFLVWSSAVACGLSVSYSLAQRGATSGSRRARGNPGEPGNQDGWVDRRCDVVVGPRLKREHFAVDVWFWSEDENGTLKLRITKFAEERALLTVIGIFESDHTGWRIIQHFITCPAEVVHNAYFETRLLEHELKHLSLEILRMKQHDSHGTHSH